MTDANSEIFYRLDADDCITEIGGHWFDVVDAVADGLALDHDLPVRVIHGFCEDCKQSLHSMTVIEGRA